MLASILSEDLRPPVLTSEHSPAWADEAVVPAAPGARTD